MLKKRFVTKYYVFLSIIIILIFASFQKPYNFDINNETKIIEELSIINVDNTDVELYFSFPNIISSLIAICTSNGGLEFYPDTLNIEIFKIIDKNKIVEFLEKENLLTELINLNKIKNNLNAVYFSDFFLPYIILKGYYEGNNILNNYYDSLIYKGLFTEYNFKLSYKIYRLFYYEFYYELYKIYELIKNNFINGHYDNEYKELILKNNKNLELKSNFKIIFNLEICEKENNQINFASQFQKIDYKSANNLLKQIGFSSVSSFYDRYIKDYEGHYFFLFYPFSNISKYSFKYIFCHEYFHYYQSNKNFFNYLESIIYVKEDLKNLLNNYFLRINEIYSELNKKKYKYSYIFSDCKSFSTIYDNQLINYLLSEISSFSELSADIYALWFALKYDEKYKNVENYYYFTNKYLEYSNLISILRNIDNINDINFWAEMLKIYLQYIMDNMLKDIDILIKKIDNMILH